MRKVLSFLLMTIMMFSLLAACGGETSTATPDTATEATTEAPVAESTEEIVEEPTEEVIEEPTVEPTEEIIEEPMTGEFPDVDPAAVEGDIVIAGSSTVYPLAQALAANFTEDGYAGNLTIDSVGSGAGFERFCEAAETDIANASRAIKDEEVESCRANGREPIEFRVGTDALAIVTSAENDFVDDLTLEQLAQIYSGEAATWADIDPSYPAEPIELYSPGTDSGTFDFFVEEVLDENEEAILGANPQLNEDDNVLVRGVQASPYAIGYFGYAYFQENADSLKALSIDGVEPNEASTESGEYALSRPLFMYSDATIMAEKPQVAAFLNYVLTFVNDEILDVGYFPASEAALEEAKQKWLDAINGTTSGGSNDVEAIALPDTDPAAVEGDIVIAGSSTVYPLAQALAANFTEDGYAGNLTIDSVGSGAGFERFCEAAETDIANASRAIKDEEVESCRANGREPIEFRVGTDALAIVTSAENDFVDDLTLEQLAQIYSGEAATWADIDPSYPAEPIELYSPGTDSGTFDFFVEEVLDENEEAILGANPQLNEDDNVLVRGVQASPYAIGYFGYAYFQENADSLKALSIDGVEPNEASTESGEYALSRPLFMYSDATIMAEKPQVAAFLNYMLSFVNDEIIEVGYFPASTNALNEAKQKWLDANSN